MPLFFIVKNLGDIQSIEKEIYGARLTAQALYSNLLVLGEFGSKTALHLSVAAANIYKYYQFLSENPEQKDEILKEIEKYENQIEIFLKWINS